MPLLMDAPVIVFTNSILIGAKAAAHPDIGDLFHVPELVTAATVMRYDRTRERAVNVCECNPSHPEGSLVAKTMPIASSGSAVIWMQCSDRSIKCRS